MGQDSTFGIDPLSIGMDIRVARAFAACCGVNLAFAALGVCGFFSRKGGFSHARVGFPHARVDFSHASWKRLVFKMEQRTSTFGVNPESNGMDFRAARAFATCCGVNLAFAAWGLWVFCQRRFFVTQRVVFSHAS
jgi:hypothetical protein